MPLDPFTGRYMPYDGSAPGTGPPGAIEAISDSMPGFIHAALLQGTRGSSTMMYGGYDASKLRFSGFKSGTADEIYNFSSRKGTLDDLTRAGRTLVGGRTDYNPIVKPFLRNLNPRSLVSGQYSDLSIFSPLSQNRYTPAGFTTSMMKAAVNGKRTGPRLRKMLGIGDDVDNPFAPGFFSSLQATSRVDALEKKMLKAVQKGDTRTIKRISAKLGAVDSSTEALLRMNNPSMVSNSLPTGSAAGAQNRVVAGRTINVNNKVYKGGQFLPNSYTPFNDINISASGRLMEQSGQTVGQVGIRGNALVSGLATESMQGIGGYFRGAAGYGRSTGYGGMSTSVKMSAKTAELEFMKAAARSGFGTAESRAMLVGAEKIGLRKGTQVAMHGGARFMAARGVQTAAKFAGPVGWVMMAYDVGKLAGQGVANGIDLAKDAMKSFQGSIYKPAFGMGYRDNEIAATSRARGVMAIQNSRLNARSVLGSEAGMMAAHFG